MVAGDDVVAGIVVVGSADAPVHAAAPRASAQTREVIRESATGEILARSGGVQPLVGRPGLPCRVGTYSKESVCAL